MGKRVKKKSRAPQKEKRVVSHSPRAVPQQDNINVDTVDDNVTVLTEIKPCVHLDKGLDLNILTEKIRSSDLFRCDDCREGVADRRGATKGKDRHGKKKGIVSVDSKSKAIWVCLQCGHYACGGIGLPTTSQSHAVRHARQTHHPLVIQRENPYLRWCFPCNTLIPVDKSEENGEKIDALSDVVKLIKGRSSERSLVDVDIVCFGGGSVKSETEAECLVSSSYVVRGLVNLGNTCFFNSVLQNLLSMNKLRDYFFNQDASFGPFSIGLKKLFGETKPENGLKNVINPRSMLGCVCSNAPHFRGYQQQDSHELLRCLLDGLSTEELAVRKQLRASEADGLSTKHVPTFVDITFGGRISSTVCCVECGHASTVYEPFLDLSLSVPAKKPPTKNFRPVSLAKKAKLPPKRGGRISQKANKYADSVPAQSTSDPSVRSGSSCQIQSTVPLAENALPSSGDAKVLDSVGPTSVADESVLVSHNSLVGPDSESEQVVEGEKTAASFEDFTFLWMDYVGTETISDEHNLSVQNDANSISQDSIDKDTVSNDGLVESSQACLTTGELSIELDSSSLNPWEEEVPLLAQSSEVLLLPYKEESYANGAMMRWEAEASSSVAGCGQDEMNFDGFGDLFNEPEESSEPVAGPSLGNEIAETGFVAGISSESDLDEVDNADTPLSIESCLAHFMKPELLSDDNAWECENCSKILQCKSLEAKKQRYKAASDTLIHGETRIQRDPLSLDKVISCSTEVRNANSEKIDTDSSLCFIGENLVSDNEKIDCLNQNYTKPESGQTVDLKACVDEFEELTGEINAASLEQSHCSGPNEACSQQSLTGQVVNSNFDDPSSTLTSKDQQIDFQFRGNCESEKNEDDEKTSKKVNVKRDATKMVFIDKAPPILTIHLKRFSQDARGRLSKLNGHVNFRDVLDLRPYMDPRCEDVDKYVYRLCGVVEHLGTMRGGHYVAYVRGKRSKVQAENENEGSVWYHASDSYVQEVTLEEVLRCEAYMLFYEKIWY